jgi:hypothetical protein
MASFVNHFCLHNTQHSFISNILIMRATKHITAGTEILIRYRERTTAFLRPPNGTHSRTVAFLALAASARALISLINEISN